MWFCFSSILTQLVQADFMEQELAEFIKFKNCLIGGLMTAFWLFIQFLEAGLFIHFVSIGHIIGQFFCLGPPILEMYRMFGNILQT